MPLRNSADLPHLQIDGATWVSTRDAINNITGITGEPTVTTASSYTVTTQVALLVNRTSPAGNTAITLPAVATRSGRPLRITDWSTGIGASGHSIVITPNGTETIMRRSTWTLLSSADDYLAHVTLWPSTSLGGWYIA